MKLTKNETNNAIIVRLQNVRKHPNADRLKLATVLGTTVVVGLEASEGDVMIYFDSNLRLSHDYLHHNNLYSNVELNVDTTKKGYFGKNGRVRAQNFRGEASNGFVSDLDFLSIACHPNICTSISTQPQEFLKIGDEFTHINGVEICSKFVPSIKGGHKEFTGKKGKNHPKITMFHKHWDTKQLMREVEKIIIPTMCYFEEKVHGTSGRIGHVLVKFSPPWWKFWAPKEEWRVVGGTRRVDNTNHHMSTIRKEIERQVAPHLYRGEQVYFEIYGYDGGKEIQTDFSYDCRPGEFKVILYRVTITTSDNYSIDLDRENVYRRAEELGMNKPHLFTKGIMTSQSIIDTAQLYYKGDSALAEKTMREGVVVWFKTPSGHWKCLKHKSEEFLIKESGYRDKGVHDVEDEL